MIKSNRLISFLLILTVFKFSNINAQKESPVNWTFNLIESANNQYIFTAEASIEDHWSIYSTDVDPDGPIPTTLTFTQNKNLIILGEVDESGTSQTGFDEMFEMELKKFKYKASFSQRFVKEKEDSGKLVGYITFMCCNEKQCLPPKDIAFDLKID